MRVEGLPATGTPSVNRYVGAKVGQLAHVGFAHDDRTRVEQVIHNLGVFFRRQSHQRTGTRAGLHFPTGFKDILQSDRNAMQKTAHVTVGTLQVARLCLLTGIRIDFKKRIAALQPLVDIGDAFQRILYQGL